MKRFLAIFMSLGIGLCFAGDFCAQNEPFAVEQSSSPSTRDEAAEVHFTENRYIVTWSAEADAAAHRELLSSEPVSVEYDDELISVITIELRPEDRDCDDAAGRISLYRGVEAVEKDSCVSLTDLSGQVVIPSFDNTNSIVNDYFSRGQYWLHNIGYYEHVEGSTVSIAYSAADIDTDAPEGWFLYDYYDIVKRPVTVAVIDTGIDYKHPELADRMWVNPGEIPDNGIDDDGNGYTDDVYGWDFYNQDNTVCHYEYNESFNVELSNPSDCDDHGTHVAGLIAAKTDNSIGIAGVAGKADVRLMSLKIHGGTNRTGAVSDAVIAIRYATKMGADICNISWGTYTQSKALYNVIKASPMLFVCAAGNNGTNNDLYPLYPASYDLDNIISVTYTDSYGKLTYDSNYGETSVDVAVPATDVFSTVVGTYAYMSGSSMAAPQVSGMAALMYSLGEGVFASEVKQIILDSAKYNINTLGSIVSDGIPSLRGMLERADTLVFDSTPPSFTVSERYAEEYLEVTFETADEGGSGAYSLCYYVGEKEESDFGKGTNGTVVADNRIRVSKSGKYTFYLIDAAGNGTLKVVNLIDDYIGPRFKGLKFEVSPDSVYTVTGNVCDLESGIKSLKFLKGRHSIHEFLAGSNTVTLGENGDFCVTVEENGIYTFCAQDFRGNRTVETIMLYRRPAVRISFAEEQLDLIVGEEYFLEATPEPANTTDRITYVSSDTSVVEADPETGRLEAKGVGEAEVFAVTESGPETHLSVLVTEAAADSKAESAGLLEPAEPLEADGSLEPVGP